MGLTDASKRPNSTRSEHSDSHSSWSTSTKKNTPDKPFSDDKDRTSIAFAHTAWDAEAMDQNASQLLMVGYAAHDNVNLNNTPHFL